MTKGDEGVRFRNLTFDDFREMAVAEDLSDNERVGFPDSYREAAELKILADVATKLPALAVGYTGTGGVIVDIGCGCGGLAEAIQRRAVENGHELVLIDSLEMLARNGDGPSVEKIAAQFPEHCDELLKERGGDCAAVLAYSVLQHTLSRPGVFEFVDAACELLAPGGRLLLADIPNASMRRRFLTSEAGHAYHREHYGDGEPPVVAFNSPSRGEMDDAVVCGILGRARASGLHAWVVPQHPDLPMANRREDILIARP
jgi:2-polyprenyl-3-methyl-5-hydroxy-6-metoxy-1,4-benzoquinol methylase